MKIKTGLASVLAALALMLVGVDAAAQQAPHVCGAGPGPNETMAGVQPAGPGVAPTPLCYWKSGAGAQQAVPQARWADRWGAIAVSSNSIVGVSTDQANKGGAQTTAVADCETRGGTECEIQVAYYNQCAALVVSGRYFAATREETEEKAVSSALADCESKNGIGCRVYYSGCSLPVQAQ